MILIVAVYARTILSVHILWKAGPEYERNIFNIFEIHLAFKCSVNQSDQMLLYSLHAISL